MRVRDICGTRIFHFTGAEPSKIIFDQFEVANFF